MKTAQTGKRLTLNLHLGDKHVVGPDGTYGLDDILRKLHFGLQTGVMEWELHKHNETKISVIKTSTPVTVFIVRYLLFLYTSELTILL